MTIDKVAGVKMNFFPPVNGDIVFLLPHDVVSARKLQITTRLTKNGYKFRSWRLDDGSCLRGWGKP